jgi:SOS-response transcriptional repressor LexA
MAAKQQQILDYIQAYSQERLYPPSAHEIAEKFGMTRDGAVWHLRNLREDGLVNWEDWDMHRTLHVVSLRPTPVPVQSPPPQQATVITDAQWAILDCIAFHQDKHGRPPTLRQIGQVVGMSTGGVRYRLKALVRLGLIEYEANQHRTLRIKEGTYGRT